MMTKFPPDYFRVYVNDDNRMAFVINGISSHLSLEVAAELSGQLFDLLKAVEDVKAMEVRLRNIQHDINEAKRRIHPKVDS